MQHPDTPDVGAQDAERKNSPILDDDARDDLAEGGPEMGSGVCYFNDVSYEIGQYVCSGSDLLCCEEGGVWVCKGSCYES